MSRPYRAVYIAEDRTVTCDVLDSLEAGWRKTPPDAFAAGLGGLLSALAPRFDREGVVVLAASAVDLLGMPVHGDTRRGPEVLVETAAAGWNCGRLSDWSTFSRPGMTLHVLNAALLDTAAAGFAAQMPLWSGYPPDLVARLRLWHDLTGSAWRLTPAAAGLAVMSRLDRERAAKPKAAPAVTWKSKTPEGPDDGYEAPYYKSSWQRKIDRADMPKYAHEIDKVRSYIATAALCEVSPWALKHDRLRTFDPRRAGWWKIEVAPWNHPTMPDPAGYAEDEHGRPKLVRWVTTPTLALLEQLTATGDYGGARILDSWTGPARKFPLKAYSERMRDAYDMRTPDGRTLDPDQMDVLALENAIKIVGHKTFGAFDSADNWAYRPHFWYSVVALDRCNAWRKMWTVGRQTGHWPMWIEVDAAWYGSDIADPVRAAAALTWLGADGKPRGIWLDQTGHKLGAYKAKATRQIRRRTAA